MVTPHTPEIKQTQWFRSRHSGVTLISLLTRFGVRFDTRDWLGRLLKGRELGSINPAHRPAHSGGFLRQQLTLTPMLVVGSLPLIVELRASLLPDRRFPNADRLFILLSSSVVPQTELTAKFDYRFINLLRRHRFYRFGGEAADATLDGKHLRCVIGIEGRFRVAL
jgi:hypothetical protein